MKSYCILVLIVLFSTRNIFGQDIGELEDRIKILSQEKADLESQILDLDSELSKLSTQLSLAKFNLLIDQAKGEPCKRIGKINIFGTSMKDEPSYFGKVVGNLESGSEVCIIKDSLGIYLLVSTGTSVGWIDVNYLEAGMKPQNSTQLSGGSRTSSSAYSKSGSSSGTVHVKGHYRTVNGKKVYVRPHTRSKPRN